MPQDCLRNLRHNFLLCRKKAGRPEEIAIEPKFREQFQIARPTREYQEFYQAIPASFIGSLDCLSDAVKLICVEIERSFESSDLTVPTWRKYPNLVSKWLPRRWKDTDVSVEDFSKWDAQSLAVFKAGKQKVAVTVKRPVDLINEATHEAFFSVPNTNF